ncbi:MAG: Gfo/Idh/MocA family protein [Terriglobia bacterium]
MNGVTGRMGRNQHLERSIIAIIRQGGVRLSDEETIMPRPLLVGRNAAKLEALSREFDGLPYTIDLDSALADHEYPIYFDSQSTDRRAEDVRKAIAAGKHTYCEKPLAENLETALDLYRLAQGAGVKHGVVLDKLWLPGMLKLKELRELGYFGRIFSVHADFGYWVFEGNVTPSQRPSWNYRSQDGGGLILDMLCHWRYLLDHLFAPPKAVLCLGATHIPERWDEHGKPYQCTAEDAAYTTFELEGGIIAQFNSSWCTRVRRDDLLTIQVDGTLGSAVAGLRECCVQPAAVTPRAVWNPDLPTRINYLDGWQRVPDHQVFENAFKQEWELFLRSVVKDEPFCGDFLEGAKGVQLAQKGLESWRRRAWIAVEPLDPVEKSLP